MILVSCVLGLPVQAGDRIVCLGDSITDGFTYGQIIMQALHEADRPTPTVICAGVGGDTAQQIAKRVEETVLVYEPTIVTFCAGTNDALKNVPPDQYKAALREIVKQVTDHGAKMILLTPCVILKKPKNATLDAYEAAIRSVAKEYSLVVAENRAMMQAAVNAGKTIMVSDGVHPNYAGQALIARALLNALGASDIPLPKRFEPKFFPGVIPQWRIRLADQDAKKKPIRLTESSVIQLEPDNTWQTYSLPEPIETSTDDWEEQIRRNGFATKLQEKLGKGLVIAVADVKSTTARNAWLNIGGTIETVWLNGKQIHDQNKQWTGFHAGKARIPVKLNAGSNRVVLEVAGQYLFCSITDQQVWESDIYAKSH